jgi:non-specific serine/threonine protein kinase/serine/threonine-protein kinase
MGIVYLAEQKTPIRRRVALKLVKLGMDTHEVLARFDSERQVLALLNHPNIARVLDAGATENGRPFFVMEYVAGVSITRSCDMNRLGVRDRVELFIQVCEGVQHAHQKGIIHRDLKPSNILVMLQDDRRVPKVIDFGLAKVTAPELTNRTLHTQQGQVIGTPAYMSPEQADLSVYDVDTRTDVYSLGVVLYELLVGAAPLDSRALRAMSYSEMQRMIREVPAPRPSSRFSTWSDQSADAAKKRQVELRTLQRQLQGDLDWITLKAMEKDRTRRYASPLDMAADLRRHLDGEPVLACPPSIGYLLRKLVVKHKGTVLAVAAVLLALVGGLVATTTLYLEADKAKRQAVKNHQKAEAINSFLINDLLGEASPNKSPRGKQVTVEEVLHRAAAKIDGAFPDQPEVEASLRSSLGRTYISLGLDARAEIHLRKALDAYQRLRGSEDLETLEVMISLVHALINQGTPDKLEETRSLAGQCLEISRRVLGEDHPVTVKALCSSADLLSHQGKHDEAERVCRQVLEVRRRDLGAEHRLTLQVMNSLAVELLFREQFLEAETLYRQVVDTCQRVLGPDHSETLSARHNLVVVLDRQGRFVEALPLAQQTLKDRRRVLGPEHWHTLASINALAGLLFQQGKLAEAEPLYRELAETSERTLTPEHSLSMTALNNLAKTVAGQGKREEAEKLYHQTLERRRKVLGADNPLTLSTMTNLAFLLSEEGKLAEAESFYRQALELYRPLPGQESLGTLFVMNSLAELLLDKGKPAPSLLAEAESLCRTALEGRRKKLPAGHRSIANSLHTLGRILLEKGKAVEAESVLREAAEIYVKAPRERDWDAAYSRSLLGRSLAAQGRRGEAEPLLLTAWETLQGIPSTPALRNRQALETVIQLYDAWNKPDQAEKWRQKRAARGEGPPEQRAP